MDYKPKTRKVNTAPEQNSLDGIFIQQRAKLARCKCGYTISIECVL